MEQRTCPLSTIQRSFLHAAEDVELYVEQSRKTSQALQPAAEPLHHPAMQDSSLDSPLLHRDGEPVVKQIRQDPAILRKALESSTCAL